ncbi:MAG TPA: DUF6468 domain-containing protein [Stellaceae bacterium]|nr:DUF6468 domain-containing protein [Stellaceae bacterium]
MTPTLISDITVAFLLIATIGYVAVLNRRLGLLRQDKAKLEELIKGLNAASTNAQAGIAGLRQATDELGRGLDKELAAGRSLRDDLQYLIERGGSIADRLEGSIRARREEAPRVADVPAPRASAVGKVAQLRTGSDEPEPRTGHISRAERELLRALGGRR